MFAVRWEIGSVCIPASPSAIRRSSSPPVLDRRPHVAFTDRSRAVLAGGSDHRQWRPGGLRRGRRWPGFWSRSTCQAGPSMSPRSRSPLQPVDGGLGDLSLLKAPGRITDGVRSKMFSQRGRGPHRRRPGRRPWSLPGRVALDHLNTPVNLLGLRRAKSLKLFVEVEHRRSRRAGADVREESVGGDGSDVPDQVRMRRFRRRHPRIAFALRSVMIFTAMFGARLLVSLRQPFRELWLRSERACDRRELLCSRSSCLGLATPERAAALRQQRSSGCWPPQQRGADRPQLGAEGSGRTRPQPVRAAGRLDRASGTPMAAITLLTTLFCALAGERAAR